MGFSLCEGVSAISREDISGWYAKPLFPNGPNVRGSAGGVLCHVSRKVEGLFSGRGCYDFLLGYFRPRFPLLFPYGPKFRGILFLDALSRLAQISVSCVVVVNGRCFVLRTPLSSLFPLSGRIVEVWKIVGWGIGRIG